ncbi:MAG TPA: YihY/virulence factor BrkB family protein [Ardenticatenaceae bacterium]|nr:YihY/virulence factor BrkB family protein [Ardenticatenaceae bacterium]
MNLRTVWELLKETFTDWSEDKASRLAAALAYYTIFALSPLLIIVIGIASVFLGEEAARGQIVGQIGGLVGEESGEAIQEMIAARQESTGLAATVIGIVTLILGASGVFGQLQDALNTIWEVAPKPGRGILGMVKDRFISFTMVLGIAFLLLVSLVVSAGLGALGTFFGNLLPLPEFVLQALNFVISFGVITLLFAMIYKVLPDVDIAWRDVWVGAAITALLFTIGKFAIGLYLGKSSVSSSFGAAGALIVILVWIYYSAQLLFLGAEFTQVYARRFGSRIQPEEDAVPVTGEARAQQGMPRKEDVKQASGQKGRAGQGKKTAGKTVAGSKRSTAASRRAAREQKSVSRGGLIAGVMGLLAGIFIGRRGGSEE